MHKREIFLGVLIIVIALSFVGLLKSFGHDDEVLVASSSPANLQKIKRKDDENAVGVPSEPRKALRDTQKQKKVVLARDKQPDTLGVRSETHEAAPDISSVPTQKSILPTPAPSNVSVTPIPTPTTYEQEAGDHSSSWSCTESGGVWNELPNSCVDSCASVKYPDLMCLLVLTEGCDCGPNKCWDGNSCVTDPGVVGKPKPAPTIEIPPPIKSDLQ